MRVKVGNVWHSAAAGSPIAIELSDADKRNIAAMHPDATRYGIFAERASDQADSDRMRDWLGQ